MLKVLREKTKTILWIVIVAFVGTIFVAWGMGNRDSNTQDNKSNIVGSVNGVEIDRSIYSRNKSMLYNQLKEERGDNYTPGETEEYMIDNQAWEMTIQDFLFREGINKLGISVTDKELVSFLRNNPHPSLQETFTDNKGNFSYQEYLKALSDPSNDWTDLENWGRQTLPKFKLETLLSAKVNISEREVLEQFKKETVKVKAKYVSIPFEERSDFEPSEKELSEQYKKLSDEFVEPEKRKIKLLEIKYEPTQRDFREVRNSMNEIKSEILDGTDFIEAAKNYSQDLKTAENGGDLGFFGKGQMDPEFEKAAFSLSIGEISDPVKTEAGYHLIKVEDKKTENGEEKVHARHILMKVTPGYETQDSLSTIVRNVIEKVESTSFEEGVKALGLSTKEIQLTRHSFIEGIGYSPKISDFAFNHDKGSVSSAIETNNSIYFLKILKIIPESKKPFEEIKDELKDKVIKEKLEHGALEKSKKLRKEALDGSLESMAENNNLQVVETPLFTRNNPPEGFNPNSLFTKACHLLPLNTLSKPVKVSNSYYIIIVTERTEPDMTKFSENREEIITEIRRNKTRQVISDWYSELRDNAEIKDYRIKTLK
ncbi:MAG: peptidylprolyl isomerase [Candidatus Krumholzibacteriota bacterium]|nr:peptidylprolyl isomerase [Candidatus Krumholzibacteriota bacterium]